MQVKLVSFTIPTVEELPLDSNILDLIAYCARVSNPNNQQNTDTSEKLINYLIKHKHWSPFEMADVTLEIETTRDIARQILRHRSFSFQEFCVDGDTEVTFELPSGKHRNKRASYKRKISMLYDRFSKGLSIPSQARVYDTVAKQFVTAPVKRVYQTGIKETVEVVLENGKSIICTPDHKFLTENGEFLPLKDAASLRSHQTIVSFDKTVRLATNGVPVWQSKEWLTTAKAESIASGEGVSYIARRAGVSYHTIRKWLKKNGLSFSKKEVATYTRPWNRGLQYTSGHTHSIETIEKMRASAKRGAASNLWKGGVLRSERQKIADWCNSIRTEMYVKCNYTCQHCNTPSGKLQLHHIIPVFEDITKAYEKNNILVVCQACHAEIHKIRGDAKLWRKKSRGNSLTVEWATIKSIKYIGPRMTYDLEIDHPSHNYVANNMVVHNSQRYADPTADLSFTTREARLQDTTNRQNSIETDDQKLHNTWKVMQDVALFHAKEAYSWAIKSGIAKEVARAVLPEGLTMSRIYMKGSIRSWIHYIEVRTDPTTQKEHRDVAVACAHAIAEVFPMIQDSVWQST